METSINYFSLSNSINFYRTIFHFHLYGRRRVKG